MSAMAALPALAGGGAAAAGAAGAAAATGAVAATAGGIFAGGGLQIFGSLLGGIGQGMMMKAEMRERERQQIAQEERAEARYRGLGEAARFWNSAEDSGGAAATMSALPVGRQARVGEQYSIAPPTPQAPTAAPRTSPMRYDSRTGRLVQS